MELRHLRYFVAVAEQENVSRAALRLHVSQPALSRQIMDLEDELGVPLLERTPKSVRLTPAGRVFLHEARAVLARADAAAANARAAAHLGRHRLEVGYAPSLTAKLLPRALRVFQARFPQARVLLHDLSTGEMLTRLRAEKLDLALMVRPTRPMLRGLDFRALARYPVCLAVPLNHPLAGARSVSLANVFRPREPAQTAPVALIAFDRQEYPEYHESLRRWLAPVRARPRVEEEHDGVTGLIAAVEAGRGVALVPSCLECLAGPRLKLIPFDPAVDFVGVGAVWRKNSPNALLMEFIAAASAGDS
jgi:DNA-binding transcriptional LysR family regulator